MARPKGKIFIAALILLVVLLPAAFVIRPFEPRFRGLPASRYVLQVLTTNRFGSIQVTNQLMPMGPALAVPALIKFSELEDSQWRRWYQRAYLRSPVSWRKHLPAPKSRIYLANHAAFALGFFGADAKPAVPALARLSGRGDNFLRLTAISSLARIGTEAKSAVPTLLKGLNPTNQGHIGHATLEALPKIDVDGGLSAPSLTALVTDGNVFLAAQAVGALALMARYSPHLMSNLWTALRDPRTGVCTAGAHGLKSHDALTRESIEPFLQELESSEPDLRSRAASVLMYCGKFATDVVPKLRRSVRDQNQTVREIALNGLTALARESNVVRDCRVEAAVEVLGGGGESRAWAMMDIVLQLQPEPEELVPQLVNVLQHDSPRLRGKAVETLGKLGPAARKAVPELQKRTRDEWFNVREAATNALRRIEPGVPP